MKPTERDLWGDVTQEVISDEEDTQERLKVKSLASSGNKEVNNLIEALDQKENGYDRDGLAPSRKIRVVNKSPVKRHLKSVKLNLLKD